MRLRNQGFAIHSTAPTFEQFSKQLEVNLCNKPLLFDLFLFDKLSAQLGTGLEVKLDVKGTVKW